MYSWTCPACGKTRDEIRSIATRDDPLYCMCRNGGVLMQRGMVYASHTLAPPVGTPLYNKYLREGRIQQDGGVKIDSATDYARITKEQGVKPMGDYEVLNRSMTRPHIRSAKQAKREKRAKQRERLARKINEKGVSLG